MMNRSPHHPNFGPCPCAIGQPPGRHATPPRRGDGFIDLGALRGKADLSEAQKHKAEYRLEILGCGQA